MNVPVFLFFFNLKVLILTFNFFFTSIKAVQTNRFYIAFDFYVAI